MAGGEGAEPKDRLIRELQQELAATKEYIRSVVEDLGGSNEELRAANEEILSTNEEFQSVNEELETAKEELQSANEELSTLNDELQDRNAELGQVNSDLNNFITSTNLPSVRLDRDLKIRSFTPRAQEVLNLIPADIGRPIGGIKLKIDIPDLEMQTLNVIHSLNAWAQEVKDREGRWYSLQIKPYRTVEDKIEGAVLLLIDIDAQKTCGHGSRGIPGFHPGRLPDHEGIDAGAGPGPPGAAGQPDFLQDLQGVTRRDEQPLHL